jgi:hypothetical protein
MDMYSKVVLQGQLPPYCHKPRMCCCKSLKAVQARSRQQALLQSQYDLLVLFPDMSLTPQISISFD